MDEKDKNIIISHIIIGIRGKWKTQMRPHNSSLGENSIVELQCAGYIMSHIWVLSSAPLSCVTLGISHTSLSPSPHI